MKFKINKSGFLEIKRAGKWKKQFCPFAESGDGGATPDPCGDWCPNFGFLLLGLCCHEEPEMEALLFDFFDKRGALPDYRGQPKAQALSQGKRAYAQQMATNPACRAR